MEFFIQHIYPWLKWAAIISPVIPFVIGLLLVTKHKSTRFRLLLSFTAIGVFTEVASQTAILLGTSNNMWMIITYNLLSFCVLAGIYYLSFNKFSWRRAVIVGVAVILALIYYDAFYAEDGITKLNSLSRVTSNAMLIIMALAYFYKVANDGTVIYLDRDPMFLFSCVVLIYYSGTSMTYAIFNEALAISYDTARVCLATKMLLTVLFYFSIVFILRRMAV